MTRQIDGLEAARRMYAPTRRDRTGGATKERTHVFTYGGETTLAKLIYRKTDGSKTVAAFRPIPDGTPVEKLPIFGIKAGWHIVGTRWGRKCWVRLDEHGFDDPSRWPYTPAVWFPGWRPHLYRVDDMVRALADAPDKYVCFTEGEKDADTLINLGFVAVASYWGASVDPTDTELRLLKDCHVVAFGDNDDAGRGRVERLKPRLLPICASVRTIIFDDLPKGADVTDWAERLRRVPEVAE